MTGPAAVLRSLRSCGPVSSDPRGALAALVAAALLGGCVVGLGTRAPEADTPRVILETPTRVPIRVVQNITLVQATLNRLQLVTLIVDTGAQSTIISPAIARRLGLTVSSSAPRRQVSVVGGGKLDVPFVKLSVLRVGDASIEGMDVGVYEVAPTARGIHGLLGADFLHQFRFTLDGREGMMHLEPLRPRTGPAVPTLSCGACGYRSRAAGRKGSDVAARTPRAMAWATASAAARPRRVRSAGASPTERAKRVSPSNAVWGGDSARAKPSMASEASLAASGRLSRAVVATTPIVVCSGVEPKRPTSAPARSA